MKRSDVRIATREVEDAAKEILSSIRKTSKIKRNPVEKRADGKEACASKSEYEKADIVSFKGRIHIRFADGTIDLTPVSSLEEAKKIIGAKKK